MSLLMSQIYNSQDRKICSWHSTVDLSSRLTVMCTLNIPIQIMYKAIYLQHLIPEITILSIYSRDLSQMVDGLKPNLQDATCKLEDSSFASLSMHLSVYFNIKCSLSRNVLIFQRWWLIWHGSSLIRAQTPACSAGVLLGETFMLALDCSTVIQGLISLFFTCLPKSAPYLFYSY